MQKCCDKTLIPRIYYRASIIDSVGLAILLGFFLSVLGIIAWGISAIFVKSFFEDPGSNELARRGTGGLVILYGLYKFLPKLINACSYLVNYKLTVTTRCKTCGENYILADYPKNKDPF